jgi:hypothetical protein
VPENARCQTTNASGRSSPQRSAPNQSTKANSLCTRQGFASPWVRVEISVDLGHPIPGVRDGVMLQEVLLKWNASLGQEGRVNASFRQDGRVCDPPLTTGFAFATQKSTHTYGARRGDAPRRSSIRFTRTEMPVVTARTQLHETAPIAPERS